MDAQAIHQKLVSRFGDKITAFEAAAAQPWAVVATDAIAEVADRLIDETERILDSCCAVIAPPSWFSMRSTTLCPFENTCVPCAARR